MRLLKFVLVFLAATIFVLTLVLTLNWQEFNLLFENRSAMQEGNEWVERIYSSEGLTDYILENPGHVSLVSFSPADSLPDYSFEPDTPRAMGMMSVLLLTAAFEEAIAQGRFSEELSLPLDQVSLYQLPDVGQDRHDQFLAFIHSEGLADGDHSLELGSALPLLTRFRSMALYDYLLELFGFEEMNAFMWRNGLGSTDPLLPFSGLYLTLSPTIQQEPFEQLIQRWRQENRRDFESEVMENTRRYITGMERDDWRQVLDNERLGTGFMGERDMLEFFPTTTAREMGQLMQDIWNEEFVSENVSLELKDQMRTAVAAAPLPQQFSDYGALYDDRIGLMNGIGFNTQAATGETTLLVLMFDRLQVGVWFHMSSRLSNQRYMQYLASEPELQTRFQ